MLGFGVAAIVKGLFGILGIGAISFAVYTCSVYKKGYNKGHTEGGDEAISDVVEAVAESDKLKEKTYKKEVKKGRKIIKSIDPSDKKETTKKVLKLFDPKKD